MGMQELSGAIAFFQQCEDMELLRETLRLIRPKAARAVANFERQEQEPPPPIEARPAATPLSKDAALRYARSVGDFGELQALARAIGQRFEDLQPGDRTP